MFLMRCFGWEKWRWLNLLTIGGRLCPILGFISNFETLDAKVAIVFEEERHQRESR